MLQLSTPRHPRISASSTRSLVRAPAGPSSPFPASFPTMSSSSISASAASRPATSSASASQLDYLEEPDVFHDVFGHVPLLAQPAVADFMQELGLLGLQAMELGQLHRVARLYWYTVEFGLALERGEPRIYGAGILSSFGESALLAGKREAAPARVRSEARAPHPLPHRRVPAELFRHRPVRGCL